MLPFSPALLLSDALFFLVLGAAGFGVWKARRDPSLNAGWQRVLARPSAMASLVFLGFFVLVAFLDSLHFHPRLPPPPLHEGADPALIAASPGYSNELRSVLDVVLAPLEARHEKTYSAPFAHTLFVRETRVTEEGTPVSEYPRLRYGGAHLENPETDKAPDLVLTALKALGLGGTLWALIGLCVRFWALPPHKEATPRSAETGPTPAWGAFLWSAGALCMLLAIALLFSSQYFVLGTDKVGQDILYLSLKSLRTAVLIGTLTTLIMLPLAVMLGLLAGYLGGWVDDAIQYAYTVLNAIPGVLLIAAAVLSLQVLIDTHPHWFSSAAERADVRFVALCLILGITSWTGLCRLIRAETLKLREMEYVMAARAFGVPPLAILLRHILPNTAHIVLITVVMDFSSLVLAEAVLSYVGIGVDPATASLGSLINAARFELARDPVVWWSLASAFGFMLALVLPANLVADAVREAFDPNHRG
jgi:peptide/nickel transport system permease protein